MFDSVTSESELSELDELSEDEHSEDELPEDALPEDELPDELSAVSNLFSDSELLSLNSDNFRHVFSPLLALRSRVWPVGDTTSSLFLFPDFAGVDFSGRSWKLLPFSAFFLASNSSKHRSSLTIACRDFTVVELERDLDSWGSRPFSRLSDSELLRS